MSRIRDLISKALDVRKVINIPVRQPLAKVTFKTDNINEDYLEIIMDEINVKQVLFNNEINEDVLFDTNLSQELLDEGILRNILRAVQDARKNASLKVGQKAQGVIFLNQEEKEVFNKNLSLISEQTSLENFEIKSGELKVEIK
jgi:hypothetical protein